jgi:uncharacterized protein (DUF3084 family)
MRTSFAAAALATLAASIALIATPGVAADDPPKKAVTLVQDKGNGPILTKDQLRTCIARKAQLKQQDADLEKEEADLAQVKADLAASAQKMSAQLESLDRTKAEAVDAYNAAVKVRDQQIDAYQARATAFNDRVDARDKERADYGPNCVNRRYREEDAAAIQKEKGK